jgi:hypothetical protein
MGEDLLTIDNILTVAGLAGVYLALAKHWYRLAQILLLFASGMAIAKLVRWCYTVDRPFNLRVMVGVLGVSVLLGVTIWAIRKAGPTLTIIFTPETTPYDEPEYEGAEGDTWKSFRIGVKSSVPTTVILRAEGVRLDGHIRHNIHLHYMHDTEYSVKRVELFKDTPDFWDIASKSSKMDHAVLDHIQKNVSKNLIPMNQEFKIVATSRDGAIAVKFAFIEIGPDGKLLFELRHKTSIAT